MRAISIINSLKETISSFFIKCRVLLSEIKRKPEKKKRKNE